MINRDESHFRAAAFEPAVMESQSVRAIMPIDSEAGGTWIAVNQFGITMALLNYAPGSSPTVLPRGRHSRGNVIPSLIHASTLDEALTLFANLDTTQTSPFRLVMTDGHACSVIVSPGFGSPCRLTTERAQRPIVLASSGLGDDVVEPARRALATQLFEVAAEDWPNAQRRLHHHRWMHAPHLSVYMLRQDARTVSITTISVSTSSVAMRYAAELGGRFAAEHATSMDRIHPSTYGRSEHHRRQTRSS
jgi:hypothetical protein